MRLSAIFTFAAVVLNPALAAPLDIESRATQKLLICSDSTTANYVAGNALQGQASHSLPSRTGADLAPRWGYYLSSYTNLDVRNLAKNGRSTRSFINEGLWSSLLASTVSGDFVLIEMGHNDDGDPTAAGTTAADRATLPGTGEETKVVTTTSGAEETVHTFGWYLRKMIADVRAKGATPIISGMVNRNYWNGNTLRTDWPFATYAQQVAKTAGVEYLDHTRYSTVLFQSFGPSKAKTYFPNDNTHTNWEGAKLNTQTFVQSVKCKCGGTSKLSQHLNAAAKALTTPVCQAC
jgi:rhamnogalacturonan acetylesterase